MMKQKGKIMTRDDSGSMIYVLGVIGAAVFYLQQAVGFWQGVLAILKALVWPAFLVYELLKSVS